jgi:D-threo-aldose 1-dehydrogenase
MISSRNAFHPAFRSLLAAHSIPGFSLDATPGTTNQRRPKSSLGVDRIKAVCDRHQVPLAAAALQFPLAHSAVASIIPGPRSVEEFAANLKFLCYPIPAALWSDLRDAKLLHPRAPTPA